MMVKYSRDPIELPPVEKPQKENNTCYITSSGLQYFLTTMHFEAGLYRAVKIIAAHTGKSMRSIVDSALRDYVAHETGIWLAPEQTIVMDELDFKHPFFKNSKPIRVDEEDLEKSA